MKNETPVILSELLRQRKKRFPCLPVQSVRAAIRTAVEAGKLDCIRSSTAKKARYYLLPRVLDAYLESLGFSLK